MRPIDDTFVKGQILGAAAKAVGATRAAAFEVYPQGNATYTLELRTYVGTDSNDSPSNKEAADGLRRFVLPALVEGKDKVIEIPELAGLGVRRYVLIVLIRDGSGEVRLVGALLVNCQYPWQAEQRLKTIQNMSLDRPEKPGDRPPASQSTDYRDQPRS